MEGIVRDRCPLCGGKIVVSDLYQTSRDFEVRKGGKVSRRYTVTDCGSRKSASPAVRTGAARTGTPIPSTSGPTGSSTIRNTTKAVKTMTFLEEVRRKVEKEEKACATCGNLVRIGGTLIGCVAHDKLILPNYPPFFGQKPCPDWKP